MSTKPINALPRNERSPCMTGGILREKIKSFNANSKSSINPPVIPLDKWRKEKEIHAIGIKKSIPTIPEPITRRIPMINHLNNQK